MVYRKEIDPRYDGNGNLKSQYRTAYVLDFIARARRAGVAESDLDFTRGENARYCECITQIALLANEHWTDLWAKVEKLREWEDMVAVLLEEYGITETEETGQLIPTMDHMFYVQAKTKDLRNGVEYAT